MIALVNRKDTTEWIDTISYSMSKNMPVSKNNLLKKWNELLHGEEFPVKDYFILRMMNDDEFLKNNKEPPLSPNSV